MEDLDKYTVYLRTEQALKPQAAVFHQWEAVLKAGPLSTAAGYLLDPWVEGTDLDSEIKALPEDGAAQARSTLFEPWGAINKSVLGEITQPTGTGLWIAGLGGEDDLNRCLLEHIGSWSKQRNVAAVVLNAERVRLPAAVLRRAGFRDIGRSWWVRDPFSSLPFRLIRGGAALTPS